MLGGNELLLSQDTHIILVSPLYTRRETASQRVEETAARSVSQRLSGRARVCRAQSLSTKPQTSEPEQREKEDKDTGRRQGKESSAREKVPPAT